MSEIKILIADDEEVIQLLLAKMFEDDILISLPPPYPPIQGGKDRNQNESVFLPNTNIDGYKVIAAYDGNEAFRKVQQESFDLVIVDIQMPGRNGIEILKAVKEKNPDTEVLIITGYASLETAIEAVRNGAYEYIEKPFDIQNLKKIVARALEKRRLVLEKQALMEQLKKRVFELDVLYNVSNDISYTLDYQQLVSLIMASINKVIEYDVSCSLLSTGQGINLMIQRVNPVTEDFIQIAKANIIGAFNAMVKNPISESEIEISQAYNHMHLDPQHSVELNFEIPYSYSARIQKITLEKADTHSNKKLDGCEELRANAKQTNQPMLVQSFFNVPLMVQGEAVGMINVSSRRENAFDENDVRLLYTIANQMSSAVKRLKEVIAAEKSKMEKMVNGMIEGVIMINEKGYMMVLNPSAKRMLSLESRTSSGIHEVTAGQLTERFRELNIAWMLKKDFGGRNGEYEAIQKEITLDENIVHISAEKIHDDNNQTIGLVMVMQDITEQKRIEQAKLDFVSGVSHEIRTPLSLIHNAVSIIEMAGEVNEKQQRFLSIATRNVDRLARLVNQVLDISKMESGKLEMHFEMLSVKSLIDDSIEAQQIQADEKGIQISGKVDEELPQVYGDRDKLEQVLTNLLNNAMKFTNEGGRITIEAKNRSRNYTGHNKVTGDGAHFESKFAEISVSDTGVGIPADDQKKIFDKFQQVNSSSNYKTTGFGLGLAITKELILSHQGKIWVDSELGRGSTFTFTIPVDKESYEIAQFIEA